MPGQSPPDPQSPLETPGKTREEPIYPQRLPPLCFLLSIWCEIRPGLSPFAPTRDRTVDKPNGGSFTPATLGFDGPPGSPSPSLRRWGAIVGMMGDIRAASMALDPRPRAPRPDPGSSPPGEPLRGSSPPRATPPGQLVNPPSPRRAPQMHPAENCGMGNDYTIYSLIEGVVQFQEKRGRTVSDPSPLPAPPPPRRRGRVGGRGVRRRGPAGPARPDEGAGAGAPPARRAVPGPRHPRADP